MARDVPGRDPEMPVGVHLEVVKVAADLGGEDGGERHLQPGDLRGLLRQQGELHPRQEVHLHLHAPLRLQALEVPGRRHRPLLVPRRPEEPPEAE